MDYLENIPGNRAKIARNHNVLIVGQADAVKFYPPEHTFLIRIRGWNPTGHNEFDRLQHADKFTEVLELHFDDVDHRVEEHNKVFDGAQATEILEFFKAFDVYRTKHPGALLMIHCQGGISRSTAVGCAWAQYEDNRGLEEAIRHSGFAVPNNKVYRTLCNVIDDFKYGGPTYDYEYE